MWLFELVKQLIFIIFLISLLWQLCFWSWAPCTCHIYATDLRWLTMGSTFFKSPTYLNIYCISANCFRGNYSFLNLTLCTVTFGYSPCRCGNYSREETIQGRKLYEEIRYAFFTILLLFVVDFRWTDISNSRKKPAGLYF